MVNKITKQRLKNVIVYDGIKIVALCVILCLILVLVFNAIAKKPSDGQDFKLIIDEDLYVGDDIGDLFSDLFEKGPLNGGFSYETLEGETVYLRSNDESPKEYVLNNVYAELSQDDVCVLEEEIYLQYISRNNAVDLVDYVKSAKTFLLNEGICNAGGEFDVSAVNAYFEKTRSKDSRFKTSEEIKKGKEDEFKRLKAIWNNANALEACFTAHPELLDERSFELGGLTITGKFAIKIDAFNGNNDKYVENLFKRSYLDENEQTVYTTKGIYVTVGNNLNKNGDLFYENLAFLYTLINTYSTYINI